MDIAEEVFGRRSGDSFLLERARGQVSGAGDDSEADREAHARVGETLNGKWKLERLLGVGGMGAVYSGLHRNGARAAVKVLHAKLAKHEGVRARFLREGYAANRVEHPSIIKVLDDDVVVGGQSDGTAYLVMELLLGESLESRSRAGLPFSERDFLVIAEVVLEALEVAHAAGVVHRDIKPDNLFITRSGILRERVKVLDFGLARLLETGSTTSHGLALGSPPFMSPEQAAGRNDEVDGRTDLFALAASGFRLLTGRRIHEGTSQIEVLQKMGKLRAPPVRRVAPELSLAVSRILDRALEFEREARYETAGAMRADVLRALADANRAPMGPARKGLLSEAPRDDGSIIELSGSDLQPMNSAELRASGAVKSIELSASDLEVIGRVGTPIPVPVPRPVVARGTPIPVPALAPIARSAALPPTQPMLAVEPVRTDSLAPVPPIPVPRELIVALAMAFVGALLAAVWLWKPDTSDGPATAASSSAPMSAASHLVPVGPAAPDTTPKSRKRAKQDPMVQPH
jgi:serine/threonine protein kinase